MTVVALGAKDIPGDVTEILSIGATQGLGISTNLTNGFPHLRRSKIPPSMKWYSVFRLAVRVPPECFVGSVQDAPLISAWTHQTTFKVAVQILATGAFIAGSDQYENSSGKCEIHAKPFGKNDTRAAAGSRDNQAITFQAKPSALASIAATVGFALTRSGALLSRGPIHVCDPERPLDVALMIIVCFTWSRGSDADDNARRQGRHRHPDWGHQLYLQKQQGIKADWV